MDAVTERLYASAMPHEKMIRGGRVKASEAVSKALNEVLYNSKPESKDVIILRLSPDCFSFIKRMLFGRMAVEETFDKIDRQFGEEE